MTRTGKSSPRSPIARSRCGLLLAAAILGIFALPAQAQEAPIVIGRAQRPSFLTLDPFTGFLSLDALMEYDSSQTSHTNSSNALIQESLNLASGGGIVSKNFFEWHGNATVGLEENWSRSPTLNSSGTGIINDFDFNGTLLGSSILPTYLYARRTQSYVERSFEPVDRSTVTEYGATTNYLSPTLPTSLSIYHTNTVQTQLSGESDYSLDENHVEFSTAYDPSDQHHLTLNYTYVTGSQSNPGASGGDSYESQYISLSHTWQIDRAGRYTLSQSLSYSELTGTYPSTQLHLGEQLRMHHTDDFETGLNYTYDQQDYSSLTESQTHTLSQTATAYFNHRLFNSLFTNGQIGGTTTSQSFADPAIASDANSDTTAYFANLSSNYNKKVPMGTLNANISLGYNQTNNGAIGTVQPVLNDFQTFTDPQPIIITRANVNPDSIAVYNANRTRRYILNSDYTVTKVGNTLWIQRPITSNINSGDTVLLDYDTNPLPGYTATTINFTTGARYDITEGPLGGLGIFAQFSHQDQNFSSTSSLLQPDNITDSDFGVDYTFWKITLHADYEDHQSTLSPYTATRLSARYTDRISSASILSLSAQESFLQYPLIGSSTSLTTLDGHLDYQISRDLKAILTARFENTIDDRFGNSMGFEEQGELRWTIRQTQVYFILRHTALEATANKEQSFTAQLGIIRNF